MEKNEQICPDCNGTGIIVSERIEPRCCMNFNESGGCCNYPLPDYLQEQEQCRKCQATGLLLLHPPTNGINERI